MRVFRCAGRCDILKRKNKKRKERLREGAIFRRLSSCSVFPGKERRRQESPGDRPQPDTR